MSSECGLGHDMPEAAFLCAQCGMARLPASAASASVRSHSTARSVQDLLVNSTVDVVLSLPEIIHQRVAPTLTQTAVVPAVYSPDGFWLWSGTEWLPAPPPSPSVDPLDRRQPLGLLADQQTGPVCVLGHVAQNDNKYCGTCGVPLRHESAATLQGSLPSKATDALSKRSPAPVFPLPGATLSTLGLPATVPPQIDDGGTAPVPTGPFWPKQPEVWDPVRLMRTRKDTPVELSAAERAERLGKIAQGHARAQPWRSGHHYGTPRTTGTLPRVGTSGRVVPSSRGLLARAQLRRGWKWMDKPGVGRWSWYGRRLRVLMALMGVVMMAGFVLQHFPSADRSSSAYAYGSADGRLGYLPYLGTSRAANSGDFCEEAASRSIGSAPARQVRQGVVDYQTGCSEGATCRGLTGVDVGPFTDGDGALFTFDCSEAGKRQRSAELSIG